MNNIKDNLEKLKNYFKTDAILAEKLGVSVRRLQQLRKGDLPGETLRILIGDKVSQLSLPATNHEPKADQANADAKPVNAVGR
jgi:hypothetical protein